MKYLAAIPLLFAVPAWGQEADEIVILLPNVDEIIVEGFYDKNKTLSQIPGSIGLIGQTELDKVALVHPAEALNAVAGVNIQRGSGQEHLTAIRSPVLTGGAGAGSFLYLEDGVPLRAAGFANVNGLFEAGTEFASKLEVFKGPGPVFFGSNAVHGLVSVQSRDVDGPNHFEILGSDDGLVSSQLSVARGPLRSSVSLVSDNGFREDSGFDQQKFQIKYEEDFGPWSVDWLSSFNNLNQETAGFIQGDNAFLDDDIRFTNPNPEAFRDGKSYRTQARFERQLEGGKTLALTPYARRAELRFLRHFVPGQALEKNGHSSVGLQSAYYDDSFNIGADVEYTKGKLFEFQENPDQFSFVQGLHYDYEVESFVGAVYAQKDVKLSDRLTLDIGARAEYTDYNYDNQASDGQSGRFIRVADRSDDFLTVTPKATLSYSFDNGPLIYARAARGSRAPQVTDLYSVQLNQVAGEADVETLDSLEVGFKGEFGAFYTELAAFTGWKDNFFFRNANGFNVVDGKTRHSGIELSFNGDITDWLSVSGGGTLARHTYNFDLDEGSPANNITSGDRVDTAPDTLAQMRASLYPTDDLTAEIEWRHVGSYFTNPGNTADYPGYDIFVLRSSYDINETIRLFGRVDNIFDKRYADRADFAFGNERFFPGRPRTLFFGVSSEF
ncbi:TonB-dependent receptor [Hellea sp.]|nr:TonB-dependent receptor [Hellea sp.]